MTYIPASPAAPSGDIGADEPVATLAAFPVVKAGAPGISGATSYAITTAQVAAQDTSGYVPAGVLSSAIDIGATFTPDGPGTVTLTVVATGPGGVRAFKRVITVTQTHPVAVLAAITASLWTTTWTMDSSGSAGTDLVRSWSLDARPPGSAAALSDTGDVPSPTLIPDLPGNYRVKLQVTDRWGRVSTAYQTGQMGDDYGWSWVNIGAAPTADVNSLLNGARTHLGGGIFSVPINAGGAFATPAAMAHWTTTLPVTFATTNRISIELVCTGSPDVDHAIAGCALHDTVAFANGKWLCCRGVFSTSKVSRSSILDLTVAPTFTDELCSKLTKVLQGIVIPSARIQLMGIVVKDGAYVANYTASLDSAGIPGAGAVLLTVCAGADAVVTGSVRVGLRYRASTVSS